MNQTTQPLPFLLQALGQVLIALLVPFVWWLVTARKQQGFFGWLGWRRPRPQDARVLAATMAGTFVFSSALGLWLIPLVAGQNATSQFTGLGWAGLPLVLVYATLGTSVWEESLFRGFLLKRVAARAGFWWGNSVQSVLFGALHMVPFMIIVGPGQGAVVGLFSASLAFAMGYINERLAGGSIVPSWCLHAAANLLVGCVALFA